eukprot:430116-Rhodomonas_salina.6
MALPGGDNQTCMGCDENRPRPAPVHRVRPLLMKGRVVLTSRVVMQTCHVCAGTDTAYGWHAYAVMFAANVRRVCSVVSSTDVVHGTMVRPDAEDQCGGELRYLPTRLLCNVRY